MPASLTFQRLARADLTPACTAKPANPISAFSSPTAVLQALRGIGEAEAGNKADTVVFD